MPEYSLIYGGAGTGKTSHLMSIMDKVIEAGVVDPYQIGFMTFTRAARAEASSRAALRLGMKQTDLEQHGWFRTVHSICYRQLAPGKSLLADDAESRKWVKEAIQEDVGAAAGDEDSATPFSARTPAQAVLGVWDSSRNRMLPFAAVLAEYNQVSDNPLGEKYAGGIVERYEQMKRLDGRCDFTDLLGRFSGWSFKLDGPAEVRLDGEVPSLEVVFADEQQDSSKLQNAVLRRLTANTRWVYLCGDPFQNIYRWAGADHTLLKSWPVPESRTRILQQTFRCPKDILDIGEGILRECSDYWDRGIRPAEHEGHVSSDWLQGAWTERLDPREKWLVLARTNRIALQVATRLTSESIPWVTTDGGGGWHAPKRNVAFGALTALQEGYPITVEEWQKVIDYLPSKSGGTELLTRGTKKRFEKWDGEKFDLMDLAGLIAWGASENLQGVIGSGKWASLIEKGDLYVDARQRWGWESVHEPQIKIGTIHSAKGMEADNVALVSTTSANVDRQQDSSEEAFNEERRVEYVAVTRARKRLLILNDPRRSHRMRIQA